MERRPDIRRQAGCREGADRRCRRLHAVAPSPNTTTAAARSASTARTMFCRRAASASRRPMPSNRPGYNPRNAPFGDVHINNNEHLSSVREPYLKSLAQKTGMPYTHLTDATDFVEALRTHATAATGECDGITRASCNGFGPALPRVCLYRAAAHRLAQAPDPMGNGESKRYRQLPDERVLEDVHECFADCRLATLVLRYRCAGCRRRPAGPQRNAGAGGPRCLSCADHGCVGCHTPRTRDGGVVESRPHVGRRSSDRRQPRPFFPARGDAETKTLGSAIGRRRISRKPSKPAARLTGVFSQPRCPGARNSAI